MTHPAIENARHVLALEQQDRATRDPRLWQAVMLAPSLTVCRALLFGERVPSSALDPVWLARFGLRTQRRAA